MEFFSENVGWLLFAYVVGSAIGWYLGKKSNAMILAEDVIDSLIEQEYLKTRGHGENMQILKHTEWCDDKNSG